jgi:CubicO group peptidase (beta-lactamase class C family)
MRRLGLGLVCLLFVSALGALRAVARQTASALKKPDKATLVRLDKSLPDLMAKGAVPGLSIALIRDRTTYWVHSFGVRDAKSGQPVTEETIFEAASLSKPVFAYGVLKLVDQGKLDLDTPLTRYLSPPYIEGDDRLENITARYVLSHRTGFPNWRGDGNALTIRFTPGERFSYSGEGFVYLQKVVEKVTGRALNDYMAEAVFVPLRMKSSSYVWRDDYDRRTATGHDGDGQTREKSKPKEGNAAASLHTTAADYALFVEAVMKGTGLKPKTVREMETPQIAVDPECTNCTDRPPKELSRNVFWGLGWGIQETEPGESLWHWGDNGAFKCFVVFYPKRKIGMVLFTNSENGLSIAQAVEAEALGGDQPAFTWIKYDRYDSEAIRFARAVRENGAGPAIDEFRPALLRGDISEGFINSTGYRLMGQNKFADAIRIFQLNVALYPRSWNVYDSLGEAYMNHGEKELAIQNYEKSLELNPQNEKGAATLQKLKRL